MSLRAFPYCHLHGATVHAKAIGTTPSRTCLAHMPGAHAGQESVGFSTSTEALASILRGRDPGHHVTPDMLPTSCAVLQNDHSFSDEQVEA